MKAQQASRLHPKLLIFAGISLSLLGILIVALAREVATTSRRPMLAHQTLPPPRPAFTPAEEAYIQTLWPIHGDVERSTVLMSLGGIFYKTKDMSPAELRVRVDQALATYRQAETRLQALRPPPSMQQSHEEYLAAVRLFRRSAVEVLKMFEDGRDDHLLAAYPMSREGSDKIRRVGAQFWRDEFPPN